MKNVLRSIFVATFAALLVASTSVPSDAARRVARPSKFDGQWSVAIYTLVGDCDRSYRYSLRIVGGRAVSEDQSYYVDGIVAPSGAIRVIVGQSGQYASGTGRLAGNSGRGSWRTSTGQCAGQWTAMRRAADY